MKLLWSLAVFLFGWMVCIRPVFGASIDTINIDPTLDISYQTMFSSQMNLTPTIKPESNPSPSESKPGIQKKKCWLWWCW